MALSLENPLRGSCPVPFFQAEKFPSTGGLISGRLCLPLEGTNATCCIPCPVTDWTYSAGFEKRTEIPSWVNVVTAVATVFLLLSFAVLDVKWTHRHYLSVCLAIGVLLMELAFIIPLGAQPDQCFNEITPNDMNSNLTCAVSGAFLLFGGWTVVIWVFWRALLLHLQICWEVVPGKKFFYSTLFLGWGIPAGGLAITFSLTGVSYRFGNVCHINHQNSLADYWGPLLAFSAVALVLQFITMGYCIHIYLRSLLHDGGGGSSSVNSQLPNGTSSTRSARQTYRRVKRVIQTQWRGAMVVLVIVFEVVFFAVVFVSLDSSTQITKTLVEEARPWLVCLVLTNGDKTQCLPQAAFVASETIVLVVLIFLGLSGFWCLLFLGRWSMVLGWRDLIRRKLMVARGEFISADAQKRHPDQRTYEMIGSSKSTAALALTSPAAAVISPTSLDTRSPESPESPSKSEYFGRITIETNYGGLSSTYTSPMTPVNRVQRTDWDTRGKDTHYVKFKDYAS